MWWLLDNYGSDQDATYLVNNRQQWFIPVVNVDGYVYNQITNPTGGGMWRKNRNGSGIDLNRNYGPMHMWNSPYAPDGSSTNPSSETYRGTAPFSELETQAIDNFMRTYNIKTCLNYHTYGGYLIYPYGYLVRESNDSLIYRDWTYDMTVDNRFQNGTDFQTVSYATRGTSDDYMFGDSTKPITFAMTPEVGLLTDGGFWASYDRIIPLAIANLRMNKDLAYFAGYYPIIRSYGIQDSGGNGFIDKNESFSLHISIKNLGIGNATDLGVSISSSNPSVQFPTPTTNIADFAGQANIQISFDGNVDSNATTGVPFQVYVEFSNTDGFQKRDTLDLYIGTPTMLFFDRASMGMNNWTYYGGWALSPQCHTQPSAFADTSYANNVEDTFTTRSDIDLNNFKYAQLRFWTKWEIEPTWDFATVSVSSDNGTSWQILRTSLSRKSSGLPSSKQPAGIWGYDSYTPGQTWVEQWADLSPFVNTQIKLRFELAADAATQWKGFFVDDIFVYGYTEMTNVEDIEPAIPSAFALNQNYPNPFNPKTLISFTLARKSTIRLQLLDILGRTVKMIASGEYQSGPHQLILDASELPTGIYFYRLEAEAFTATRKLVLLK